MRTRPIEWRDVYELQRSRKKKIIEDLQKPREIPYGPDGKFYAYNFTDDIANVIHNRLYNPRLYHLENARADLQRKQEWEKKRRLERADYKKKLFAKKMENERNARIALARKKRREFQDTFWKKQANKPNREKIIGPEGRGLEWFKPPFKGDLNLYKTNEYNPIWGYLDIKDASVSMIEGIMQLKRTRFEMGHINQKLLMDDLKELAYWKRRRMNEMKNKYGSFI